MIIVTIATIWAIVTLIAMLYGVIEPVLNRKDNQERFNKYK
jgi:hypothetical protein